MSGHFSDMLKGWTDQRITLYRVKALLDRGAAVPLAMENWLLAHLWVFDAIRRRLSASIEGALGNRLSSYGLWPRQQVPCHKNPDEVAEILALEKSQTNTWLKRTMSEGKVRKLFKPERY